MAQITTAELAAELDASPRDTRKFLRSLDKGVGKGSRYAIEKREVRSLKTRYAAWDAARKATDTDAPETPTDA